MEIQSNKPVSITSADSGTQIVDKLARHLEQTEGKNADAIAAVDGVDVLFVGPLDLSFNLECPKQYDHPDLNAAFDHVIQACRHHNKAAGILSSPERVDGHQKKGFTFVAVGSD